VAQPLCSVGREWIFEKIIKTKANVQLNARNMENKYIYGFENIFLNHVDSEIQT
jgi:hypothetical protein